MANSSTAAVAALREQELLASKEDSSFPTLARTGGSVSVWGDLGPGVFGVSSVAFPMSTSTQRTSRLL